MVLTTALNMCEVAGALQREELTAAPMLGKRKRAGAFLLCSHPWFGTKLLAMSTAAELLDRADPLARFRAEFYLPPGKIYLAANSLGLLSRRTDWCLLSVLEDWRIR